MKTFLSALGLVALFAGAARASGQFQQNTLEQFNFTGSSENETYVSGSDPNVALQLDYAGRAAGLAVPGSPAWYNQSWSYRLPLTVQSTNSNTLFNYQVKLVLNTQTLVNAGRMLASGADMRFTGTDGVSPLNYFIESGMDTSATTIWVQVSTVSGSGSTTVYMYYGNAAAAAASSLSATFSGVDSFIGANGSAPSSAWTSVGANNFASSTREIESNQMQYVYASSASTNNYYGLTSTASFSSAGTRYRVLIDAETTGQSSTFNLCNNAGQSACFSNQNNASYFWMGFTIVHSTTPTYALQVYNGNSETVSTLVHPTATTAGFHVVEVLIASNGTSYSVALDGTQIYSGSVQGLANAHVSLVAASTTTNFNNFIFGAAEVGQYSSPEPAFQTPSLNPGAEQGSYFANGTYTSEVVDTGNTGTLYNSANWVAAGLSSATLSVQARASDVSIGAGTWTVVSAGGGSTGLTGRYFQYQAAFGTTNPIYTASVSSVTFAYLSVPPAPINFFGTAESSTSILWSWANPTGSLFLPSGYDLYSSTGGLLAALPPTVTSFLETGLSPNTLYQSSVTAYNAVGSSSTMLAGQYTLTAPPAISASPSSGTWYGGGTTFTFTNLTGFGAGEVSKFLYVWTLTPTYTFGGSEQVWNSGTVQIYVSSVTDSYYFHALPYNATGSSSPAQQFDLGPFEYGTQTNITMQNTSVLASGDTPAQTSVLVSSAVLYFTPADTVISTRTISFAFQGSTASATTDATGTAGGAFTVPSSTGVYTATATFAGDAFYNGSSAQSQVTVTSRPSFLVAPTITATVNSTVTITVNLIDELTSAGLAAKPLSIYFSGNAGSTVAVTTDGSGVAIATFAAVSSASSYTYTATYAGNTIYQASTRSNVVNVGQFATDLIAAPETPSVNQPFQVSATLADASNNLLASKTIIFLFAGSSATAVTGASGSQLGVATATFITASTATATYSATFPGDPSYLAVSATATVTASERPTTVSPVSISTGANSPFSVTATVTDAAGGYALAASSVIFTFLGSTVCTVTDVNGLAQATFTAPSTLGMDNFYVTSLGGPSNAHARSTATVTVTLRPSALNGLNVVTTASQQFNAQESLVDQATGAALPAGSSVFFTFWGSSIGAVNQTVTTDQWGNAIATFTAPAGNALSSFTATFAGNATNAATADSRQVAIGLRLTTLFVAPQTAYALDPLSAAGQLNDTALNTGISTETVVFGLQSSTQASVTQSGTQLGLATAAFTAPLSSGTYPISATFLGQGIYVASTATGTLTVQPRRTFMEYLGNPSCTPNNYFTMNSTLLDSELQTGVGGGTVTFTYNLIGYSTNVVSTTNASGIANTGNLLCSSATLSVGYAFSGNATFAPSSGTATVAILPRLTAQTNSGTPSSVAAGQPFTLYDLLSDVQTSVGIATETIVFSFNGSTTAVVTAGGSQLGVASMTLTAPISSGTYAYSYTFGGDSVYGASTFNSTILVTAHATNIVDVSTSVGVSLAFGYTAQLVDASSGTPVVGANVNFIFAGATTTVATNASGFAILSVSSTVLTSTGTYPIIIQFLGNSNYFAVTSSATVTADLRPTFNSILPVTSERGKQLQITDTLEEDGFVGATPVPVGNRSVSFIFQGSTYTVMTATNTGIAVATITVPSSTGTFIYTANFAGDNTFVASSSAAALTVLPNATALVTGNVSIGFSQPFAVGANLSDDNFNPVVGASVTFTLNLSQSTAAVTDSSGNVTINGAFTAPASTGVYSITAYFAGNASVNQSTGNASVIVSSHSTSLTTVGGITAYLEDDFTGSATLTDSATGSKLAGQTVYFNFFSTNTTPAVAIASAASITNSVGVATASFATPATTGTYMYSASYPGSIYYASNSSTATVSGQLRLTSVQTSATGATDQQPFPVTAVVTDGETSAGLSGVPVVFSFQGSTQAATTSATGYAYVVYTASAAGTYTYFANFAGNTLNQAANASALVVIGQRNLDISPVPISTSVSSNFTAQATLTDALISTETVSFATVTFVFNGTTVTAYTNAAGVAVATFTAPASSGTYTYTVNFTGNSAYSPNSQNAMVTDNLRLTALLPTNPTAQIGDPWPASATLIDSASGNPISTSSVLSFVFQTTTETATTNGSGVGSVSFSSLSAPGMYTYSVLYGGSTVYALASNTGTLTVNKRGVTMTPIAFTAYPGASEIVSAGVTLTDTESGVDLTTHTVYFTFLTSSGTEISNLLGVASDTFASPLSTGAYDYVATDTGSAVFAAVMSTVNFNVLQRPTTLVPSGGPVVLSTSFVVSAMLTDVRAAAGVAGASVTFTFNGATVTVMTNGLGQATTSFLAAASTGTYTLAAFFTGTSTEAASNGSAGVNVILRPTLTVGTAVSNAVAGNGLTLTAQLDDELTSSGLSGQNVYFRFGSSSQTATTNGTGQASASFSAVSSGPYSFSVTYLGTALYNFSSDTEPVTVNQRPVLVSMSSFTANASSNFYPVAIFTDQTSGQPMPNGRTVDFYFQSSTEATTTAGGLGQATTGYLAPGLGAYGLYVTMPGDSTYATALASSSVSVLTQLSAITELSTTTYVSQIFTATGTVTASASGAAIAGSTVTFQVLGSSFTATTNASGGVSALLSAPVSSGPYSLVLTFTGNGSYLGGSSTQTLTVLPATSTLSAGLSETVPALTVITATATLTSNGTNLYNQPVSFYFQGSTQTVNTASSGLPQATTTFVAVSSGAWYYSATYAGTNVYAASSASTTITVTSLVSTITATAGTTAYAQTDFTAQATLTLYPSGTPIQNQTVWFGYGGNSLSAQTNSVGVATQVFNAGNSSGTYNYSVTFSTSPTFVGSSSTATVTVGPRPTSLLAVAVSTYAQGAFLSSATLTDTLTGSVITNGQPLVFSYLGTNQPATTNGLGVGTTVYYAGVSTGSFNYSVTLATNATYGGSSSTMTATIVYRPTSESPLAVTVEVTDNFIASATVTDVETGAVLNGQPVYFTYTVGGASGTATTNAIGLATMTFYSGGSTGPQQFSATVASGTVYGFSSSSATVTVAPRSSSMTTTQTTVNASGVALSTLTATATLLDQETHNPVPLGTSVIFTYGGASSTTVTGSGGLAQVAFNPGTSSGTYYYWATSTGTPIYGATSSTSSVTILPRPTALATLNVPSIYAGSDGFATFSTTGTLTDVLSGSTVPVQLVTFIYQSASSVSWTNSLGVATAAYAAGNTAGILSYSATLSSGPTYAGVSSTSTVQVNLRPSTMTLTATAPYALGVFTASATVTDFLTNNPIVGDTVWFSYSSGTYQSATTNSSGVAGYTFSAGSSSGTYGFTATLSTQTPYNMISSTSSVIVSPRPTSLAAVAVSTYALGAFPASAVLTDVINGTSETVTAVPLLFSYLGTTQTATTALGAGTTVYFAGTSTGSYTYSVTLASNAAYGASSATTTVTINYRPTAENTPPVGVEVTDNFIASATVTDFLTGTTLSGQTVYFTYTVGGASGTATTNGVGLATMTFYSGGSTGPQQFSATVASGPIYGFWSSTGAVTVSPRVSTMTTTPVTSGLYASGVALSTLTATATLLDQETHAAVPVGTSVIFMYGGTSSATITGAGGLAQVAFNPGASSGTYSFSATSTGTPTFAATTSTSSVVILPRPAALSSLSVPSVYAGLDGFATFNTTATLTDVLSGSTVPAQLVTFIYEAVSPAVTSSTTNVLGVSTATYTAGTVFGSYNYSATLSSGPTYAGVSSTSTVQVSLRPSTMTLTATTANALGLFTASATVTDFLNHNPVVGDTVWFSYSSGTYQSATTNSNGVAGYTFSAGSSSGTYGFTATLSTQTPYNMISSTSSVIVNPRPTSLAAVAISTYALGAFPASAVLTDVINGTSETATAQTLQFAYLGTNQPATTALGVGTTVYYAGTSTGSYTYSVTLASNAAYGASSSTAAVTINSRPTLLQTPLISTPSLTTFIASATVTDYLTGTTAPAGLTVYFTYTVGGASGTATTNASGLATMAFYAGGSAGPQQYSATVSSGLIYGGSSSTGTVMVTVRATTMTTTQTTVSASGVALSTLTATATLLDQATLSAVPAGTSVIFMYGGTSSATVTGAGGAAQVTFNPGTASGLFQYSATSTGTATYGATSSTSSVTVLPRPTSLASVPVPAVYAGTDSFATFSATATLMDVLSGSTVPAQIVTFIYQSVSSVSWTNSLGVATAAYAAGNTAGTLSYSATLSSGTTYAGVSSTSTVQVSLRPSTMTLTAATAYALGVFTASATITDFLTHNPVVGDTVWFSYSSGTYQSATTNSNGVAGYTFSAGSSSGTYGFTATLSTQTPYNMISSTSSVIVNPRPTSLAAVAISTYALGAFPASAVLTDGVTGTSETATAQTLQFAYLGTDQPATTALGVGTTVYYAGTSTGSYTYSVTLASNAAYGASSSTAAVTINSRPTLLQTPAVSTPSLTVFIASATVLDYLTGTTLGGQTVYFTYTVGGASGTATTNGSGLATMAFYAGGSAGPQQYSATVSSGLIYGGSSSTGTVMVTLRTTTMTTTQTTVSASGVALSTLTATATLLDQESSSPVPVGTPVVFMYGGTSSATVTGAGGLAQVAFNPGTSSGTYQYSATSTGTATYGATSSTSSVTVLPRPTSLATQNVPSVYAGTDAFATFDATGTLTDVLSGLPVSLQPVTFLYQSVSSAPSTNSGGAAVAAYAAGNTAGLFNYSATVSSGPTYSGVSSTSTVQVNLRPSTMTLTAATANALGLFTASATVTDFLNHNPIVGDTVWFSYSSGAYVSALTNASGLAAYAFSAGTSSGTYGFTATLSTQTPYGMTSSTASVIVSPRPITVSAPTVINYTSTLYTATATVTDVLFQTPVSGSTVSFVFQGSTQTALTNGMGQATTTFMTPNSSGTYAMALSVSTNATYGSAASTAAVIVAQQFSLVSAPAISTMTLTVFTASATLTDGVNGSAISGETLSFVFQGSTQTALTNSMGLGTTTFFSGPSSGTAALAVTFAGDTVHSSATYSTSVTILPRPSAALAAPASTPAMDVFLASATVTDPITSFAVTSGSVSFVFQGTTQTVALNALGTATTNFYAPASTGTYKYSARFLATATYLSTCAVAAVTATPRPTSVGVSSATAYISSVFTATGTLRDVETGTPIAGGALNFSIVTTTYTASAATDGTGTAETLLTVPASSGPYAISVGFSANSTYAAASGSATLTAVVRPSFLSTAPTGGYALNPLPLTATLTDQNGNPVLGRTVSFVFTGSTQTAATSSAPSTLGQATTNYFAPAATGTYAFSATFYGDSGYSSSTVTGVAAVQARPTNMSTPNISATGGQPFISTATLTDYSGATLANKYVALYFATAFGIGTTNYAYTNSVGQATATFTAPASNGNYTYQATFFGDTTYSGSLSSGNVRVGAASFMSAASITTVVLDTFTFQSQLTDANNSGIANQPVVFTFYTSTSSYATQTGVTNAQGYASSTFTANVSSGVYTGAANFLGSGVYAPSSKNVNITVNLRGTFLSAQNASAYVGSSVTVQARYIDDETSIGISSRSVMFAFSGTTLCVHTDSSGLATAVFPPVSSSGVFAFTAVSTGDAIYAPATGVSSATVSLIPTAEVPLSASGSPNAPITLSMNLISLVGGAVLPSKAVAFYFGASSAAVTTNASGVGSAVFTAPASSGSYSFQTLFAGDTTYAASSATGTASIGLRATNLSLPAPAAYVGVVMTATATLTDVLTSTGVSSEKVMFSYGGTTVCATSGAYGVAVATFAAPAGVGSSSLSAWFAGDTTYAPSSAAASVSVVLQPTAMSFTPVSVSPVNVFFASMTLDATLYGLPVSGQPVSFYFQGSTVATVTSAFGVASASFTAPVSTGVYTLSSLFAGTAVYSSTQAYASVVVSTSGGSGTGSSGGGTGTVLTESPVVASVSQVFVASATLAQTSGGAGIAGEYVSFDVQGTTVIAMTNSLGLATAAFTAPATSGTFVMSAYFAGDTTYSATSSTASLTVLPLVTQLIVPSVLTSSGSVFITTGTLGLVSPAGPLTAQPLQFFFQGATVAATTDGFGMAETTFTAPSSSGSYVMVVSYAGTPTYAAVFTTAAVVVQYAGGGTSGGQTGNGQMLPARIALPTADGVQLASFTATAVFTDLTTNLPVAGRTLNFLFQGSTFTAVTTSSGTAAVTLPAEPLGQYALSSYFVGDSTYAATSASGVVVVGLGLQPADPMNLVVTTQTAISTYIAWNLVTQSVGGVNLSSETVTYSVETTTNISLGSWNRILTLGSTVSTLTLPTFAASTWLRVVALTPDGFRSPGLSALDLSPYVSPNRVFLSASGAAWVEVPPAANQELQSGGTGGSITLTTISASGFLFAYQLSEFNGTTYNNNFTFNQSNGITLNVSLPQAQAAAGVGAAAYKPKDINGLALYYNDGVQWVKLGGISDSQGEEVSINLRRTGSFAAGYTTLAGSFSLTLVAPRVFTPLVTNCNNPTNPTICNTVTFTFQNPDANPVNIRIFDVTGAQVRSTLPYGVSNSNTLYWDGRDDSGRVVKSGVYIYQIETAGQKPQTGTIAVAK